MKKLILTFFIAVLTFTTKAQAPVDFTANDCNSVSHNLFNELNSGKIVIIAWVMPCSNCTSACQIAYNVANSYSVSNPGTVVFYIADDIGTTSCATLNNWITTNSLTSNAVFTNSVINMSDYGAAGMPKLLVLGGISTHSVYYNVNGGGNITTTAVQNAVSQAVTDVTGLKESSLDHFAIKISPNPANNNLSIAYKSNETIEFTAEIFNALGQKSLSAKINAKAGENTASINTSELADGTYFLKLSNNQSSQLVKFIITH
jgi:hypothetical protein